MSFENSRLPAQTEQDPTPMGADQIRILTESLDAAAARMRAQRYTYREIAEIQTCSVSTAKERVDRGLKMAIYEDVDTGRQFERARLDLLWHKVWDIAMKPHYAMAHGKVVYDDAGQPVADDSQNLTALKELRALGESYRRLEGLDSPTRVEQSGGLTYQIVGVPLPDITGDVTG